MRSSNKIEVYLIELKNGSDTIHIVFVDYNYLSLSNISSPYFKPISMLDVANHAVCKTLLRLMNMKTDC